jgi:integrase
MTKINLDFVHVVTAKGRRYYYFRQRGKKRVKLPGVPGSKEFMAAYSAMVEEAQSSAGGAGRSAKGSVAALIALYFQTAHFQMEIGEHTRAQIRLGLNKFRDEYGDMQIALCQRKHLSAILLKLEEWPRRNMYKALVPLFKYALETEAIKTNPLADIKVRDPKTDGYCEWTEVEIKAYRAHHALGTMARLAIELLFNTVARGGSDAITFGPRNIWNGRLVYETSKTKEPLSIPVLPELQAALDAMPPFTGETFLTTARGGPFSRKHWQFIFARWVTEAGLPTRFRAHGLRKAGLNRFAEHGATESELRAWSGHKNLAILARYIRKANKPRLADNAADKLRTNGVKPATPKCKTLEIVT